MKKKLFINFFLIVFLLLFTYSSFASTNVQNRSSLNLHVKKNITVTSSNKQLILDTPYVDASEKIYDFANLFTDSEEKELYSLAEEYIDEKNMDLVIVTINNNNKSSSKNYADDFYDYNDFGIGTNYSGIILLIDMDNRKVWISTTGDAIKLYPDSYLDTMLDKIQSNLKSKKYYTGAKNFISMAKEKEYSSSSKKYRSPSEKRLIVIVLSIIGIVMSIAGSSIFCGVKSAQHKPVKVSNNANDYFDSSSFKVTKRNDKFANTHTTRTARIDSSSSSSGGSSTHIGSSGTSHGGGRKKFLNFKILYKRKNLNDFRVFCLFMLCKMCKI